jgi:hypothetical protein
MTKKAYHAIGLVAVALVATAVWRMEVQAHPQGGWDLVTCLVEAVKTGIVIPFLIVGLGILAIPWDREQRVGSAGKGAGDGQRDQECGY